MKNRITPTNQERTLKEGDFVVSKTDTQGRLTYCNEIFLELSGYSETELLGAQHNIIRHPDMPRGVFHFLWSTLKEGRECFAYVKNMAKDGSYYWVFAHMTPDIGTNGQPIGYTSVRRCPQDHALDYIKPLYAQILATERAAGSRNALEAGLQVLQDHLAKEGKSYEELVLTI